MQLPATDHGRIHIVGREMLRSVLLAILLVAPAAGAGDARAADGEPAACSSPWSPGERLEYSVALGLLPTAALVRLDTLAPVPAGDEARLRLRAEVLPGPVMEALYPFSYRLLSTVTLPGMLPQVGSRQMEEGGERLFVALEFDHPSREVRQAERAAGDPVHVDRIERDTRDLLSALYHLRTVEPGSGTSFSVFENRKLYRVRLHPVGSELIEVAAGRFEARRYRLEAEGVDGSQPVREMELWISDDGRCLPLRLQASTPLGLLVSDLTLVSREEH